MLSLIFDGFSARRFGSLYPLKRVHHLHTAPHKVAHIARGDDEQVLLRGGGDQHVGGAASDALRLKLAAQQACALGD